MDQGGADIGLHLASNTIEFRIEKDGAAGITDGSDLEAIRNSFARLSSVPSSSLTITEGPTVDLPSNIDSESGAGFDGENRIYFFTVDSDNSFSAVATTLFTFSPSTGNILDSDIVFNESDHTFSTTTPSDPNTKLGSRVFDIEEVASHEIMHAIGLDHSPIVGRFGADGLQIAGFTNWDFSLQATLFPIATGTIQGRTLEPDDIAAIATLYPNSTFTSMTGSISGRVITSAGAPIRGAHVVAVKEDEPEIPIVGCLSDVASGGPGGEYTITGLAPGDYLVRIEPLTGTTNPFTEANTFFSNFDTSLPAEFYDGATESDHDYPNDNVAVAVVAGLDTPDIDIIINESSPPPPPPPPNDPPTVSLASPPDGVAVPSDVTFNWSTYDPDGDTLSNVLFVSADTDPFSNPIRVISVGDAKSHTMSGSDVLPAGTFSWGVRVSDGVNPRVYSAPRTFTVEAKDITPFLYVNKFSLKLNPASTSSKPLDSLQIRGSFNVKPSDMNLGGSPTTLTVGGLVRTFRLSYKGSRLVFKDGQISAKFAAFRGGKSKGVFKISGKRLNLSGLMAPGVISISLINAGFAESTVIETAAKKPTKATFVLGKNSLQQPAFSVRNVKIKAKSNGSFAIKGTLPTSGPLAPPTPIYGNDVILHLGSSSTSLSMTASGANFVPKANSLAFRNISAGITSVYLNTLSGAFSIKGRYVDLSGLNADLLEIGIQIGSSYNEFQRISTWRNGDTLSY